MRILYRSEDFPPGTVSNGFGMLAVTWDEILWAAMTVGRPSRNHIFSHADSSVYEAIFRCSLVRMAIEQETATYWPWNGQVLKRTDAFRSLDPSEKGAVTYFLGLTFCKLFASKLLDTPWLLHVDVWRPMLDPVLRSRSRPDLVGEHRRGGNWYAFECKGRTSPPDSTTKANAKTQAQRLVKVQNTKCALHIAAITYFKNETLEFYWQDPEPNEGRGVVLPEAPQMWRHHYRPVVELLRSRAETISDQVIQMEDLDLEIGVHPDIASHLQNNRWREAKMAAQEIFGTTHETRTEDGYFLDGILVRAGQSWHQKYREFWE